MDELRVERVLRAVEQIPPGRLVSYGDIGRLVGMGARQVGTVMRHWGSNVAWWRVVNASGRLPEHLRDEARERWAAEGIVVSAAEQGVSMSRYRADLVAWARDWERACADLGSPEAPDAPGPRRSST